MTDKTGINQYLDPIFRKGDLGKFSAYMKRNVYIVIAVVLLLVSVKGLIGGMLTLNTEQRVLILTLAFLLPLTVNLLVFLSVRFSLLGVRFSKKTNIVFAYNLESFPSDEFSNEYNALVEQVKNEIVQHGLGEKVRVVVVPTHLRLKGRSAAEAKVMLGLEGSTLLVWGHVTPVKGKPKFVSSFSYEYGYPATLKKETSESEIAGYIAESLRDLISIRTDVEDFSAQIMPTVLFILGVSTFTLKQKDKAEDFLNTFIRFVSQAEPSRQIELSSTLLKARSLLTILYRSQLPYVTPDSTQAELDLTEEIAKKIINLEPNDYVANTSLAYIYDLREDEALSEQHTAVAGKYAPQGMHHHLFNKAYFALKKGDYVFALQVYKTIPNLTTVSAPDVSNYLNRKFQLTNNPAFVFADGYISTRWGDKPMGLENLEKFTEIADAESHAILIKESENLKSA